ncbi:MAG: hypothetical protein MRZ34_03595 [Bacillales bacterium]|nr:hypothetical protein [Bacillales bacterium]
MLRVHNILKKYNIVPTKIVKNNNVFIIDDKYVVKENKNKDIYHYLDDRSFKYYPKIVNKVDDDYLITEYIKEEDTTDRTKIEDMIDLTALLHNKTTFYKKVDVADKKEIYEDTMKKINDIFKYYDSYMVDIESKEIYSPSEYLLAVNISIIFSSLYKAKERLDSWYENIKDKDKVRYVINHNNLDISHFIKSDNKYLTSWDKASIGLPIYDLYNLFTKKMYDYDLILDSYTSSYPLLDYEKELLLIFLLIPHKIEKEDEYDKVVEIVNIVDKLVKFNDL